MKKTILLLIVMMVMSVGFISGCIETKNNDGTTEDSDEVELVNYKIETFGAEIGERPGKIGDGFIHNETAKNGYYKITGTIKNIAGKMLINIEIKADFYDINNTFLGSITDNISSLKDLETADFNIICLGTESYFEEVEEIELDFQIESDKTTDNDDTQGDSNEETDKIELIAYTVETFGGEYGRKPEKIGDGFIHNESAENGYYQIRGTIRNIAGRTLNNITVKVDLYDKNHTYLGSEYSKPHHIYDLPLPDNETAEFKVNVIYLYIPSYFLDVEEIEFELSGK